jgi:hypothetical protein
VFRRSPEAVTLPQVAPPFSYDRAEVLGACNKVKAELRAIVADLSKLVG